MAVTCTTSNLADLAKCFTCLAPNVVQGIRIKLLCSFINGDAVNCDVDTLVEEAKCYACLSPVQREAIETYLVCQIAGGSAGGLGLTGVVDPNNVVLGSPGFTYTNTVTHTFWIKETGFGTTTGWVQYI